MEVIIILSFLTTKELQEKFKVTRGTINNWRNEGMPFKKIGRLVRFDYDKVIKWIDENK